jgi:transcriptional regulator with XRE-family HTH domain
MIKVSKEIEELRREGMQYEGFREGYAAREAMIRLGAMLRKVREASGETQESLAAKIGMSQPAISRLESGFGPHGPEMDTVTRFVHGCRAELVIGVKPNEELMESLRTTQLGAESVAFATTI